MPGMRVTHSSAMTQPAALPGVRINTHSLRNSSAIAWICCCGRLSPVRSPEIRPPLSAAGAAVSFDAACIQRDSFRRLGRRGNRLEYLLPDTPLAPAGKAIVDRLVGAIFLRAVDPAAAGFQHRLVCRQPRFDLRPLFIAEPKHMCIHPLAPESVGQPLESKHP